MHQYHHNIQILSSQMGFKIQSFSSPNYLYYFSISLSLILCFLLISSSSSAKPLPHRSPPLRRPSLLAGAHHRTTLHGGAPATTPFTANKSQMEINNKKKKITAGFKRNGNNNHNNKPTAFSVMLPKGFVPPSGSSPCHNENPESVAFYCHLSSTNP